MTQLFSKTTEQLRDAFVRSKFGELAVFWRRDIEEWLEWLLAHPMPTPPHIDPPDMQQWTFYLPMISMKLTLHDLLASASNNRDLATPHLPQDMRKRQLRALLSTLLASEGAKVFLGSRWILAILSSETYGEQWYAISTKRPGQGHEPQSYSITPFDPEQPSNVVADVLFAEWLHQRQFAWNARQRFLGQMKLIVADRRKTYEAEFDRAVAVTSDGLRILHVDRVIVCDPDDNNNLLLRLVFYPEVFHNHKILRIDREFMRVTLPTMKGAQTILRGRGIEQIFATQTIPRTLYVLRKHVPEEVLAQGIPFDPTLHS